MITYHDQFALVPSVLIDETDKVNESTLEQIKARIAEQAGTAIVTGVTEISIGGGYRMFIPSKPIINIDKYMECVADAVHRYYEEEQEAEEPVTSIANVIDDIANDKSVTFKEVEVVTSDTAMELNQSKNSLGSGVIKASDAVVIPARQTYSEF